MLFRSEKEGYEHFMLKEIMEQPKAVHNTISPRLVDGKIVLDELKLTKEDLQKLKKNKMKAIKKEVNNPCEVIDIDCRYVCDVIKAVPELGYIERVPMENNILLLADEEGHIKGSPHNFFLSFPNSKHFPVQDIIGTVVFIKTKPLPPLEDRKSVV